MLCLEGVRVQHNSIAGSTASPSYGTMANFRDKKFTVDFQILEGPGKYV